RLGKQPGRPGDDQQQLEEENGPRERGQEGDRETTGGGRDGHGVKIREAADVRRAWGDSATRERERPEWLAPVPLSLGSPAHALRLALLTAAGRCAQSSSRRPRSGAPGGTAGAGAPGTCRIPRVPLAAAPARGTGGTTGRSPRPTFPR